MPQLDLAAQAARSDRRALGQVLKFLTIRDKGVAGIFTFGDCAEVDAIGKLKRDVLQTVHRKIDASFEKRLVDFFCEKAFAADLRQRYVENLVAGRLYRYKFHGQARPTPLQLALCPVRLPERESATSCPELDVHCGGLMLKILRRMSANSGPSSPRAICFSCSMG